MAPEVAPYGVVLDFNATVHREATLVCEQACQFIERLMHRTPEGVHGFADYVTYQRGCIEYDCRPWYRGKPPWEHQPSQACSRHQRRSLTP